MNVSDAISAGLATPVPYVVASRVDALKLGYRVQLDPELVHYLKARHQEASKHGASAVRWRSIVGSMGFQRAGGTWHVRTQGYQLHLVARGPGSDVTPEGVELVGWTVEIVWAAQMIANIGVDAAVNEGDRIARELGQMLEVRTRRLDLCADVANFRVTRADADRFIRRSRAKVDFFVRVHENGRGVTGVTVCPGGVMMARCYDKVEELNVRQGVAAEETKLAEQARWRAGGWNDIDPVTRVEFQLQGDAIKEFGLRNPHAPIQPATGVVLANCLSERLDAIWQRCLEWLKLVRLTKARRSECKLDPAWLALKAIQFVKKCKTAALRFRVRGRASVEQALGCAISVVGGTTGLEPVRPSDAETEQYPVAKLADYLQGIFARTAEAVGHEMTKKWGGAAKALEHVWTVHDARRALFGDAAVEELPKHEHQLPGALRRAFASSA